jgi:hypothetical protein
MLRAISVLCLFALLVQSCFFMGPSPQKRLNSTSSVRPVDAAIIPGLPLVKGQWDTLLKTRILWSVFLYKNGYVKNLIFSGNSVYTKWTEGKAMAQYAIQLGVRPENIYIDTLAEHSTENLFQGYQLAKKQGFKTIALASDPFQCAMLYHFSKKTFEEAIYFLPVISDSISAWYRLNPFIDSNSCVNTNFVPLAKRQSYRQRLKGTEGKNIPGK